MSRRLYDAHNHLQDERFGGRQRELLAACAETGVAAMVVNGSCEADWPQVLALVRSADSPSPQRLPSREAPVGSGTEPKSRAATGDRSRSGASVLAKRLVSSLAPPTAAATTALQIIPSFGYHPWYIHERTADWLKTMTHFLDEVPSGVGEIGLDRWKPGLSYYGQEEVFIAQLRLAAEKNLPVSIHCLQAWGRMLEILQTEPRPTRGFLLHSYGGSKEMVTPLANLGAYFSLPGYYAHARKARQREAFQHVPAERLLIETDAPDQRMPETQTAQPGARREEARNFFLEAKTYPLIDSASGQALNHPANLAAVYAFAAELRGGTEESLATQVEENFLRLFGGL
jgi:TatD DNase family protein